MLRDTPLISFFVSSHDWGSDKEWLEKEVRTNRQPYTRIKNSATVSSVAWTNIAIARSESSSLFRSCRLHYLAFMGTLFVWCQGLFCIAFRFCFYSSCIKYCPSSFALAWIVVTNGPLYAPLFRSSRALLGKLKVWDRIFPNCESRVEWFKFNSHSKCVPRSISNCRTRTFLNASRNRCFRSFHFQP